MNSCFLYGKGPAPTAPDEDPPPPPLRRFTYNQLRRATSSFSPSSKLGQGGFGPVFRGILPSSGQHVAVKIMDSSGSLQGLSEFHNEISFSNKLLHTSSSSALVLPIGFFSDNHDTPMTCWWMPKRQQRRNDFGRRVMLVYDLMHNGSLQDALLDRKCPPLLLWASRFSVALDIARGLRFLHLVCDPPVIHGDIKPSNILLDSDLSAKIADFGLARFKPDVVEVPLLAGGEDDAESVMTTDVVFETSPSVDVASVSDANMGGYDRMTQATEEEEPRGSVKEYVMEWIKAEVKEQPKSNWMVRSKSVKSEDCLTRTLGRSGRKKHDKRSEWWAKLDEESQNKKTNRPAREWWREEFCEELTRKHLKKSATVSSTSSINGGDENSALPPQRKKKQIKNGSRKWWMDGTSREKATRETRDWSGNGEGTKSVGTVSSTPSMRGTVCYVAPEYGGGGPLSEKCDIYSFGVLLLVLISGRRPLQVMASPINEFERANLISWARHLARAGRLVELVDPTIREMNKEQVLLCITVALLCIQRSPARRPDITEILGMLTGQSELPRLPVEFSPSPPGRLSAKSRKKAR